MGGENVISDPSMDVDPVWYTTLVEPNKMRKKREYNNDFTTLDPYQRTAGTYIHPVTPHAPHTSSTTI
jgi:hypothetical protein